MPVGKHDSQTTSLARSGGSALQSSADRSEGQVAERATAVPALVALASFDARGLRGRVELARPSSPSSQGMRERP